MYPNTINFKRGNIRNSYAFIIQHNVCIYIYSVFTALDSWITYCSNFTRHIVLYDDTIIRIRYDDGIVLNLAFYR